MMRPQMKTTADVVARIRAYRKARGMSARQLAEAITAAGFPISRAVLANQENGRVETIPVDQLAAAAQVFGLFISELFEGGPCPTCGDAPPPGFTCNSCGTEARQ
jgi:transcriptional regulator with XRE-family HTH domain